MLAENRERRLHNIFASKRHFTNRQYRGCFKANATAIREADLVIAALINYGRDLGFEVGFVYLRGISNNPSGK